MLADKEFAQFSQVTLTFDLSWMILAEVSRIPISNLVTPG